MDEREPTPEEDVIFEKAMSEDNGIDRNLLYLYHYRSGSTAIKSIFKPDSIKLRLTLSENFPDKMEGQAIEVYYDIALEELLLEKKIGIEQYEKLCDVTVPDEELIISTGKDGIHYAKHVECRAYVICFSSVPNAQHMFQNYGKGKLGKYCLCFLKSTFNQVAYGEFGKEIYVDLVSVVYGRQAVDILKREIYDIISKPALYKDAREWIRDKLHRLKFRVKRKQFHNENEIRMIVYVPKRKRVKDKYFRSYRVQNESFLELTLPKYSVLDLSPSLNNSGSDTELVMETLNNMGYDYDYNLNGLRNEN